MNNSYGNFNTDKVTATRKRPIFKSQQSHICQPSANNNGFTWSQSLSGYPPTYQPASSAAAGQGGPCISFAGEGQTFGYRSTGNGRPSGYQTGRYQPDVQVFGQLPMHTQAPTSYVSTEQPPAATSHTTSKGNGHYGTEHGFNSVCIE